MNRQFVPREAPLLYPCDECSIHHRRYDMLTVKVNIDGKTYRRILCRHCFIKEKGV